jgi:hypothetical protein
MSDQYRRSALVLWRVIHTYLYQALPPRLRGPRYSCVRLIPSSTPVPDTDATFSTGHDTALKPSKPLSHSQFPL